MWAQHRDWAYKYFYAAQEVVLEYFEVYGVVTPGDHRPGFGLDVRGIAQTVLKPFLHQRMK